MIMRTDRHKMVLLLAVLPFLAGCETMDGQPPASVYGEANRQTMMAQVVNPDPVYDELNPPTSGERAAAAIERHRTDTVEQPERVSTSSGPQ